MSLLKYYFNLIYVLSAFKTESDFFNALELCYTRIKSHKIFL